VAAGDHSLVCVAAFFVDRCRCTSHILPQVHTDRPLAIRVRMQSTELFHFSQTFETQITHSVDFFFLAPVDSPDALPMGTR